MAPTGARPEDLVKAQVRVAKAMQFDPAHSRRLPLPLLPVARAAKAQSLWAHLAGSQGLQAWQAACAAPALALDFGAAREALAMAEAVATRCMGLQAQWLEGLTELGQEMGELRQTNTVAKYVAQESNLTQQVLALVSSQVAAAAALFENTQLDVAWWLHQRASARG